MHSESAADPATGVDIPAVRDWRVIWLLGGVVVVAAIALAVVWTQRASTSPSASSAEAGFARDMAAHHAQAVDMALAIRDTTTNDEIRFLATDIVLTQQTQIGQMRGWLEAWDLPLNSDDPPMAWADMSGHAMTGSDTMMPGMATADQVRALRAMTGVEADREFLRMMVEHHRGGVMMAQAVLDDTDVAPVRRLAGAIVAGQQNEIDAMTALLAQLESP